MLDQVSVFFHSGLGYADVENRVPCKPETVMRIASISKSLTMAAVAKLWEEGKLELDAPVQKYVPEFPEKEYEGEPVSPFWSTKNNAKLYLSSLLSLSLDPSWLKYLCQLIFDNMHFTDLLMRVYCSFM